MTSGLSLGWSSSRAERDRILGEDASNFGGGERPAVAAAAVSPRRETARRRSRRVFDRCVRTRRLSSTSNGVPRRQIAALILTRALSAVAAWTPADSAKLKDTVANCGDIDATDPQCGTGSPMSTWDVRLVTDMAELFKGKTSFNADISAWDTHEVTNMQGMFYEASAFNQPVGNWDTSKVTNIAYMFYGASAFNQPVGLWDTSQVTTMQGTFQLAASFNKYTQSWVTSQVTNFNDMFTGATAWSARYSRSGGTTHGPPTSWSRIDNVCDASWVGGSCGESMSSGSTCTRVCKPGYTSTTVSAATATKCNNRVLTVAACTPNPCVASSDVRKYGGDGELYCFSGTVGGTTGSCTCTCDEGYTGAHCDVGQCDMDACCFQKNSRYGFSTPKGCAYMARVLV